MAKIVIKGGTVNNVKGDYYHHDYSQHTTNIDCYNVTDNDIDNVNNSLWQTIYQGQDVRSTTHNQARIESAEAISSRSLLDTATQELDVELPVDGDAGEVSMAIVLARPQSLSGALERLTLDERISQPDAHSDGTSNQAIRYPGLRDLRQLIANSTSKVTGLLQGTTAPVTGASGMAVVRPAPTHPSPSGATKFDDGPKYVTIQGDYIKEDRTVYDVNINSHNVTGNSIKRSFNEREEVIG
ncbi:hypothetical protein BYT27DRAFT_7196279 [Phlegmacium glaucopus]|nr:hypothetical protein BYT27DRAFT_7196279 [Phlegmacium glaucopus]